MSLKRIVLFASGSGSNVENIHKYLEKRNEIEIAAVFTNNPNAYVIERCKNLNIDCLVFDRDSFYSSDQVLQEVKSFQTDLIVLAGFLWLIPGAFTREFQNKIINIHPALLPKYGGKGMYGDRVHQAVIAAGEKESGISIHYVNDQYDEGKMIFQAKCPVEPIDDYESLAKKVHALEYKHFPEVIEKLLLG